MAAAAVRAGVATCVAIGLLAFAIAGAVNGGDGVLLLLIVVGAVAGGWIAARPPAPLSQATLTGLVAGAALALVRILIGAIGDRGARGGGLLLLASVVLVAALGGGIARARNR